MPLADTNQEMALIRRESPNSISSYPQIPRRQSSLSASLSDGTCDQGLSTRTPSLCESLYQIRVVKIRERGAPIPQFSNGYDQDTIDDPFVEKTPRFVAHEQHPVRGQGRYRPPPRLTVRWSSGSWESSGLSIPSISTSRSLLSRPPTPQLQHPLKQHPQANSEYICPMDLPIAFVDLKLTTSNLQIGLGPTSLWTSVHISADVSSVPFPGTSGLAPLDVIILLDTVSKSPTNVLMQMTLGPSAVASHLIHNHDRIALARIDPTARGRYQNLLSLGFHPLDVVQSTLDKFTRRRHIIPHRVPPDHGNIIQQVANTFGTPTRPAFCHLFFVSVTPPNRLSIPWIDPAIGVHTITPHSCLPLNRPDSQTGWHISYDSANSDACPSDAHFMRSFMRRVSKVIRQLRTGIRPGAMSDLKLSMSPGHGCLIKDVIDGSQLSSLRPGESWIVPVQVSVPRAFQRQSPALESSVPSPLFEDLITQINELLEGFTGEITQPILTASVNYRHSLLPMSSTVLAKTQLTVLRVGDSQPTDKSNIEIFGQSRDLQFF